MKVGLLIFWLVHIYSIKTGLVLKSKVIVKTSINVFVLSLYFVFVGFKTLPTCFNCQKLHC